MFFKTIALFAKDDYWSRCARWGTCRYCLKLLFQNWPCRSIDLCPGPLRVGGPLIRPRWIILLRDNQPIQMETLSKPTQKNYSRFLILFVSRKAWTPRKENKRERIRGERQREGWKCKSVIGLGHLKPTKSNKHVLQGINLLKASKN